jgi:hypothetical protein
VHRPAVSEMLRGVSKPTLATTWIESLPVRCG